MKNLNWNTQQVVEAVQDGCEMQWKVETLPSQNKFETTVIMVYHTMLGKKGPYLTIRGYYLPSEKNVIFNPDNCPIHGITLGDNHNKDSLSIYNKNSVLSSMYSHMQKYLTKLNLNLDISATSNQFDDNYDNN